MYRHSIAALIAALLLFSSAFAQDDWGWSSDSGWGNYNTSDNWDVGWNDNDYDQEYGWGWQNQDDYGVYSSDYDYQTDDDWFDGWYGDSDDWF